MPSFNDYYAAEDIIEDFLRKELIGPVEPDEILDEPPLELYSIGILWPQRTSTEKIKVYDGASDAELEEMALDQSEFDCDMDVIDDLEEALEVPDGHINQANVYRPSAMAITMVVSGQEEYLKVRFRCASYIHHEEVQCYENKVKDENGIEVTQSRKRIVHKYIRNPIDSGDVVFSLKTKKPVKTDSIPGNIDLELFVRKTYPDGSRLITVSAINNTIVQNKEILQNTSALFQCHLSVISQKGFLPMIEKEHKENDLETENLNMLYRDVLNFASGHGCSVKWKVKNNVVYEIESDFIPVAEIFQMKPCELKNSQFLKMTFWNDKVRSQGCDELDDFIKLYEEWFFGQKEKAKDIKSYERAINANFANIQNCIKRLKNGVMLLRSNDIVWKSFLYMNEAMIMQRINYAKTKGKAVDPAEVSWYPFQLAFILQIIPDIVDDNGEWHNTVDLLFFPTGGGKTEAYLGISAFVIFYRKLTGKEKGDGVAIIMRYTLRLLTAQQFERATALICACEYLRQKYSIPGCEISIGLWVGMDVTPNTLEKARESIEKIKDDELVYKGNPIQIFHCPFCGSDIDVGDYKIEQTMKIKCPNKRCHFHDGLPIYVVDEDIYNVRPTLILSTIDKFARIVWEDRTVAIFGSDGITMPPNLIIQDELHLISGPLGSISGIYEAAIDELCTQGGIKPKIIASTATVRNAAKQIKALYDRESFQFPSYGIDINDSFFAKQADKNSKPVRRYLGICETGGSLLDILVRVYSCLFFAISHLEAMGIDPEIIDQYFTVVGYFNSLKDLGSSATVLTDRVGTYCNSLRQHKFKKFAEAMGLKRIRHHENTELTSRKSSKEIKETLEELEIKYPDERAYSYLLASNMLSVGIDIGRLGIMTVYGQPKSNAEYIQATSRVGRKNPGMVIPLYNAMRSRDKSHYEQFTYYHQTFYKHVEPTSLTPFSYRAIEKALHSVYVALIRHKVKRMRDNADVINFRKDDPDVKMIKQFILNRVKNIAPAALEFADDWLSQFELLWEDTAKNKSESFYYALRNKMPDTTCTLLVEAEKENLSDFPSTLNALRNVDFSSNVFILNRRNEGDKA